jgi:general secretion pathway protein G
MFGNGFSFIELMILVVIVGLLAVVVVPEMTEGSTDVREETLRSHLVRVRSWIRIYKTQHEGCLPSGDHFLAQMTMRTNAKGQIIPIGGDPRNYPYGPYLRSLPDNPYTDHRISSELEVSEDAPGGGNAGWHYNPRTGQFSPDSDGHSDL